MYNYLFFFFRLNLTEYLKNIQTLYELYLLEELSNNQNNKINFQKSN